MRLRDFLGHVRTREHDCPCCYQRFASFTDRLDQILGVHARDFDGGLEILDEAMMPYFGTHYGPGPEGVEFIGATNDDYVQLLFDEGDPIEGTYRGK